ncbi:unnamed protein product [Peniophora sp. CBMAI 1063]|nr:unnamed protein product [Peniophora sp. CBMAI 1063]
MAAADPTYPLYPVASILAAASLLLVLTASVARQSWNLGVVFLSFWLCLETFINGVNEIVWSDNADIKHVVYCDIVTHLQLISSIVKPASTFIITRRLYLIASLRSVELPNPSARRRNLLIEWTLGLVLPVMIGGPIYYVVQSRRFTVVEGFGCLNSSVFSVLTFFLITSWSISLPLLSIVTYLPMVARVFYRQGRDTNQFLNSNGTVSRTNYLRVLAVASTDMLLTLPIGITNLVLFVLSSPHEMTFYPGWEHVHSHWNPTSESYSKLLERGTFNVARTYFTRWTSPVLAFAIFALFGLTTQARATYWRPFSSIKKRILPQRPKSKSARSMVSVDSDQYPHIVTLDAETGSHVSIVPRLASSMALSLDEKDVAEEYSALPPPPKYGFVSVMWPPKPTWTAADVPDLSGKVVLVTGGNAGIGRAVSKILVERGARVYIAARDRARGIAAVEAIRTETGKGEESARFLQLDLADLASIRRAAEDFLAQERTLDILFNNAGIGRTGLGPLTAQGYDDQFGVNVLGHFFLTKLLLPALLATGHARVVNVSSNAHDMKSWKDGLAWDTLVQGETNQKARKREARYLYSQSKLGNVLFSNALARKYGEQGIVSISLHPGSIRSSFTRHFPALLTWILNRTIMYDISFGVITPLYAGTSVEAEKMNGEYLTAWARRQQAAKGARDEKLQDRLWEWCEEQIKAF